MSVCIVAWKADFQWVFRNILFLYVRAGATTADKNWNANSGDVVVVEVTSKAFSFLQKQIRKINTWTADWVFCGGFYEWRKYVRVVALRKGSKICTILPRNVVKLPNQYDFIGKRQGSSSLNAKKKPILMDCQFYLTYRNVLLHVVKLPQSQTMRYKTVKRCLTLQC